MPKKKPVGIFMELPPEMVTTLRDVETYQGIPTREFLRLATLREVAAICADRAAQAAREQEVERERERREQERAERERERADREREKERERQEREKERELRRGRPQVYDSMPPLPDDVERAATASGFAGVYAYGKRWKAFWDKSEGELGIFDTAEAAAIARYWFNKGRVSGVLPILKEAGSDQADLDSMANALGAAPIKAFKVGDVVNYDPVIGPGPIVHNATIVFGPIEEDGFVFWKLSCFDRDVRQEDIELAKP